MSERSCLRIAGLLEPFLFVCLALMAVLVFVNVVLRATLGGAITWADEVARMLFMWLTFIGAALGVIRGSHIGMDIVVQMVSPASRRKMEVVSVLFILIFLGVWGGYGLRLVSQNLDYLAPATGIPMGYVYLAGPVGAVLMAVSYVRRLFTLLTTRDA